MFVLNSYMESSCFAPCGWDCHYWTHEHTSTVLYSARCYHTLVIVVVHCMWVEVTVIGMLFLSCMDISQTIFSREYD